VKSDGFASESQGKWLTVITSSSNPLIKRIKRLRKKKYRQQEGVFFAEGLSVVLAAVEHGANIDTIVFSRGLLTSKVAWDMLAERQAAGTRCVELSPQLFQAVSDRDNPVGLGAIIAAHWIEMERLEVAPDAVFVALVDVAEPGNLGTIVRTIDACGASGLILVGQTVDPFHPTAVKASMGTIFSVPVCHLGDPNALLLWATSKNLHKISTSARAKDSYKSKTYRFPALLMLGSEREGLPPDLLAAADVAVSIPMVGAVSSLNLAVATGVLLYELFDQRSQPDVRTRSPILP
jgi:TrmH family RNA methyltransferase